MDEESNCGNCYFWKHAGGSLGHDEDGHGECRRRPPAVIDSLVNLHDDPELTTTVWDATRFPISWHQDWCGEYRHKNRMP